MVHRIRLNLSQLCVVCSLLSDLRLQKMIADSSLIKPHASYIEESTTIMLLYTNKKTSKLRWIAADQCTLIILYS